MSLYGRLAYETLQKHSLAPKKRFGQNFLVNKQTAEAIVKAGEVNSTDTIIEVGVGLGALTAPLSQTAKRVIGYEIDNGLIKYHEMAKDLPENVELIHQDFLKANLNEIVANTGKKLKILANLPYSISNPFIFKLIDNSEFIANVTVMLQKEVADRLCANVGTKEYGVPTVLLATCSIVSKKLLLKPEEFHPRPKIDSEVIAIDFSENNLGLSEDQSYSKPILQSIVRTTFNQRRKTLLNTLSHTPVFLKSGDHNKQTLKEMARGALESVQIDPKARPETLSPKDFIRLAIAVENIIQSQTINS